MFDWNQSWNTLEGAFISLCITFLLASVLVYISYENTEINLTSDMKNSEHMSIYECGFDPYQEPQDLYFIQYFSISILFLIFDLELIYLLPWALYPFHFSIVNLWIIGVFFGLLVIGYIIEWVLGSLNWLKVIG